jgi:hypothetical protein
MGSNDGNDNAWREAAGHDQDESAAEQEPEAPAATAPEVEALVARARAQVAARQQWEREDEAKALKWYRKNMGAPGGPTDPTFDVPLARGGVIAMLMRADLSSQAGADHFFRFFSTVDGTRPSLEQLRMAQEIGRFLNAAIMNGGNPENWELVRRARDELSSVEGKRCVAVAFLAELREYRERDDAFRAKFPNAPEHPGAGTEFRAFKTLETLVTLDQRFASVNVCELVRVVREDQLGPVGIAVKLSLRCGAFDDALTNAERESPKLAQREKRTRGLYDAALRKARERQQKSSLPDD